MWEYLQIADDQIKTKLCVYLVGIAGGTCKREVNHTILKHETMELWNFPKLFRDAVTANILTKYNTMVQYIMVVYGGFKEVIHDVSLR